MKDLLFASPGSASSFGQGTRGVSVDIRSRSWLLFLLLSVSEKRQSFVPVFPYLDNWLLKAGSPQAVVTHLQTTANLLHAVGFTINMSKSPLIPAQKLPFIGAILAQGNPLLIAGAESPGHLGCDADVSASVFDLTETD
mgnify:CR=1 FL=1